MVQDVYGSPDVLRLEDIDVPEPGDDDVLARVHAAAVDAGVWHLMAGRSCCACSASGCGPRCVSAAGTSPAPSPPSDAM
jgi:NADPH:quinone reductase-like Zn-dependent oxidoreductase